MKRLLAGFFSGLLLFFLLPSAGLHTAAEHDNTVDGVQRLIDGLVGYQQAQSGAASVQAWIDGALTDAAGETAEWYILALHQSGTAYDLLAYQAALHSYLDTHSGYGAVSRQKYALALLASDGANDAANRMAADTIGKQGGMSWVFGLHLLQNGCHDADFTADAVRKKLLSLRLADGGWALRGTVSDVDVTAMTVQALAPYYEADASVRTAVDEAVALLSMRQLPNGDYESYGVANLESVSQVIVALSALGIDCLRDSRFVKNGKTLLDGLVQYRLTDGSFCHTAGGAYNHSATVQTFCALTAIKRQQTGRGSFYVLDRTAKPQQTTVPPAVTTTASLAVDTVIVTTAQATTSLTTTVSAPQTTARRTEITTMTTMGTTLSETTTAPMQTSLLPPQSHAAGGGYQLWVCLGIGVVALGICVWLFVRKKRNYRNFLAVLLVAGVAIAVVLVTDIQSRDAYYGGGIRKADAVGTVMFSIRCDTAVGLEGAEEIPADGVILEQTAMPIAAGDTVFDVLTDAARAYEISVEHSGGAGMRYVSGIAQLYEFAFGDLSGWVYHVNGAAPSESCDACVLQDGDTVEWRYTCDLGEDLK